MISVSPNTKIFLHIKTVDFRMGIDGLCGVCKYELNLDPFMGAMFVFSNKLKNSLKILFYDGTGFWIYYKRLSSGKFNWWPSGELCTELAGKELMTLIWNGNPETSNFQRDWKSIKN